MNPLVWFVWVNECMAYALRKPRRSPLLRVIEGGRKHAAPRALRLGRVSVVHQVR